MNTACSDDGSPNAAHKCALPMFAEPQLFWWFKLIGIRNIFIHGSTQSQREKTRLFSSWSRASWWNERGASAPWSRRRPKRASTFSLVKRFFFLPEKEMVQTPIISKIIYIIWGHIQSWYILFLINKIYLLNLYIEHCVFGW